MPVPEAPPGTHDHAEEEGQKTTSPSISLLNRKLNKLFDTLPANIQMGVVGAIESYIAGMPPDGVEKEQIQEAYDDFKKTYMEEELKKMT